ncbi:MAG: hypothetical protein KKF30_09865 [Proteobacteria bacterium]|nr:hypothetical protein [Pseudomonadota bacterium]MBU4468848.1 hypothetical protein [Pseudomonadota bacterium]MCG2750841.1 hypothetical protein [Desulfobacteraceae bacterium]
MTLLEMLLSSFIVGFMVAVPPGTVTVVAAQKAVLWTWFREHGFGVEPR